MTKTLTKLYFHNRKLVFLMFYYSFFIYLFFLQSDYNKQTLLSSSDERWKTFDTLTHQLHEANLYFKLSNIVFFFCFVFFLIFRPSYTLSTRTWRPWVCRWLMWTNRWKSATSEPWLGALTDAPVKEKTQLADYFPCDCVTFLGQGSDLPCVFAV